MDNFQNIFLSGGLGPVNKARPEAFFCQLLCQLFPPLDSIFLPYKRQNRSSPSPQSWVISLGDWPGGLAALLGGKTLKSILWNAGRVKQKCI